MKIIPRFLLPALGAGLFLGCASTQVNWDARVGQLTYDQAVSELGPPARQSRTADGKTVGEWISRYYPASATGLDSDFRYHSAAFDSGPASTDWRESKLRLTFNTNNVLSAWSKD